MTTGLLQFRDILLQQARDTEQNIQEMNSKAEEKELEAETLESRHRPSKKTDINSKSIESRIKSVLETHCRAPFACKNTDRIRTTTLALSGCIDEKSQSRQSRTSRNSFLGCRLLSTVIGLRTFETPPDRRNAVAGLLPVNSRKRIPVRKYPILMRQ